jgi:hypothetical protein
MENYLPLMGAKVDYNGNECIIVQVPQHSFITIPDFTLMPTRADIDIGEGMGKRRNVSAMEFEVECKVLKLRNKSL